MPTRSDTFNSNVLHVWRLSLACSGKLLPAAQLQPKVTRHFYFFTSELDIYHIYMEYRYFYLKHHTWNWIETSAAFQYEAVLLFLDLNSTGEISDVHVCAHKLIFSVVSLPLTVWSDWRCVLVALWWLSARRHPSYVYPKKSVKIKWEDELHLMHLRICPLKLVV